MDQTKLYTEGWTDYELIDAGGGKKLERWGDVITIRPELQAYFKSGDPHSSWNKKAHWEFISEGGQKGIWKSLKHQAPEQWQISYGNLNFDIHLTKFKHVGLFPEQKVNWEFIKNHLSKGDKFLNLFAYTGAASCISRAQEAETIHVDSVKQLITWAKQNMGLSGLNDIKWVHDDALKFASREYKRGKKYDGIIMDPPAWGIGAKNEKWKLEEKLDELLANASGLIDDNGFLIMNTYSPTVDLKMIRELSDRHFINRKIDLNELWMKSTSGKDLFYGNLLRVT